MLIAVDTFARGMKYSTIAMRNNSEYFINVEFLRYEFLKHYLPALTNFRPWTPIVAFTRRSSLSAKTTSTAVLKPCCPTTVILGPPLFNTTTSPTVIALTTFAFFVIVFSYFLLQHTRHVK